MINPSQGTSFDELDAGMLPRLLVAAGLGEGVRLVEGVWIVLGSRVSDGVAVTVN